MRTDKEILEEAEEADINSQLTKLCLEVLLDIRNIVLNK